MVAQRLPMGDVIDRAAVLLQAAGDRLVAIDEVTAGLLDARFVVEGTAAGLTLIGERRPRRPCARCSESPRRASGASASCRSSARSSPSVATTRWRVRCWSPPPPASASRACATSSCASVARARRAVEMWIARGDPMRAGSPFGMLAPAAAPRGRHRSTASRCAVRQQKLRARVARHVARATGAARRRVPRRARSACRSPTRTASSCARRARIAHADGRPDAARVRGLPRGRVPARPGDLVLEDLHWGDLPSVKFIDAALRSARRPAAHGLALARPEVHELFPELWAERGVAASSASASCRARRREQLVRAGARRRRRASDRRAPRRARRGQRVLPRGAHPRGRRGPRRRAARDGAGDGAGAPRGARRRGAPRAARGERLRRGVLARRRSGAPRAHRGRG